MSGWWITYIPGLKFASYNDELNMYAHSSRKKLMRKLLAIAFVLAAPSALSHPEDRPINSGSELRDWCKAESQATFIGKGQTPFNWSASWGCLPKRAKSNGFLWITHFAPAASV